jgi:hypothetical protein
MLTATDDGKLIAQFAMGSSGHHVYQVVALTPENQYGKQNVKLRRCPV